MIIKMKTLMFIATILFVLVFQVGCGSTVSTTQETVSEVKDTVELQAGEKVVYFAGGCFWGTEKLFSDFPGISSVTSGYANGHVSNPTYEQVCQNMTGARETVRVIYNPAQIKLTTLLDVYFAVIDPTVTNRQGADVGSQYQTGIYYSDEADTPIIEAAAEKERAKHKAFAVEIKPLSNFYKAEEYHQHYLDKNPGGYCHITLKEFEEARKMVADANRNQ